MKFRKEFLLLSIVSIIFLAGCTGGSSTGTGLGISIQSFTASPASVEGGTPVLLTLTVQNTGESDATGVTAELIGLPFTINDRIKQVGTGTIARADPQLGLPQGEQQVVFWDITTTPRDTTTNYEAKARVTYNYITTSENVIRVVSSDYYRTLSSADQQSLKRGVISSQYTKGPLTVTIITPQPVVPAGTVALPLQIQVENTGNGRTFLGSLAVANLDKISVDAPGLNCPTSEIRLVQGESGRITCQPTISVTGVSELQYKIILRYKYYADSAVTFSVVKSLAVTPTTTPAPQGGLGQQCRTGSACDSGLVCSNNICVGSGAIPTGGLGQQCRTTSPQCDQSYVCSNNFCIQPTTTTQPDFSIVTPGAGNSCPSGYIYKSFLNQCRTNYENSQAVTCESTAVPNGRNQWNWDQHNCFFVPQPTRSAPAANNQPASPNSPPTMTGDVFIGLQTSVRATCRYNTTTAQTTYDSMTNQFSTTDTTTHFQNLVNLPSGTHVYNAMCFDGTSKNTDQFIIKFIKS